MEPLEFIESQGLLWFKQTLEPYHSWVIFVLHPPKYGEWQQEESRLDREPGFYREVDVDESIEIHVIFEGFYYYKVDNETYHIVDKTAVYEGNNLRKYKASKILGPNDVRLIEEDKLCHFGIICDNRVVDVLSYCLPKIEIIHKASL